MKSRINLPILLSLFVLVFVPVAGAVGQATVSLDPPEARVQPGNQVRFTPHIEGARDPYISWGLGGSLDPAVDLGTISTDGVYTAPRITPAVPVHVVVTVLGRRGGVLCSASAPVRFGHNRGRPAPPTGQRVTVSIRPRNTSVVTRGHLHFRAKVRGMNEPQPQIAWTVYGRHEGPEHLGTIDHDGHYIAPDHPCENDIKVMATVLGPWGDPIARDVVDVNVVEITEHPGEQRFHLTVDP